jgi:hypothetical protein
MALNKYIHRPKNLVIDDLEIEYNISKRMFDEIASTRGNKNLNPYIYVIEYINETFGLLGTVTAIVVDEENSAQASRIALD